MSRFFGEHLVRGRRVHLALLGAVVALVAGCAGAGHRPDATAPGAMRSEQGAPERHLPARFAGKAGRYYRLVWGIDSLSVKLVESGELVRFAWRVVDPERAALLNDKKLSPSLVDPQAGVSLVVPVMEKVGQLRQAEAPEAGRSYWMVFSNKGRRVKHGDRVSVLIGEFRADGLGVD